MEWNGPETRLPTTPPPHSRKITLYNEIPHLLSPMHRLSRDMLEITSIFEFHLFFCQVRNILARFGQSIL